MLIFLKREAQRDVIQLLRRALRPGGLLFLGRAESLGPLGGHFEPVQAAWRVYRRLDGGRRPAAGAGASTTVAAGPTRAQGSAILPPLLAGRFWPPSALVDDAGDILELAGGG